MDLRDRQQRWFDDVEPYSHMRLKKCKERGDKVYYSIKKPGSDRYVYCGSSTCEEVRLTKEAHYLAKSLPIICNDIDLLEQFLEKYESISFSYINAMLPNLYQGLSVRAAKPRSEIAAEWKAKAEAYKSTFEIIRPEELVQPTLDGKKVRSKSEAMIYNFLLEGGYTFVYELPIETPNRTFYPDFTILSEIDLKTVILIEHQGKYGDDEYRARSDARQYSYWSNGFLPGRDVYFTYDDNRGGFDIRPIVDIVRLRVRPPV